MSTPPPPRHGPGQRPPDIGHPARRHQGFGLGVALAAAILGGLAIQGSYAAAALGERADTETAVTATTDPQAAEPNVAAKATDQVAECTDALRANVANPAASDDLPAVCVALGPDGAQQALDRVAAEYGVDAKATTAAASAGVLPAPKGVTVSGDYADTIRIRSFKAERDILDSFAVTLRLQNTGDAAEFVGVKVTALRGEEVVATADGIIESIDAGQTITTEPISADEFPKSTKGITYEVELGS